MPGPTLAQVADMDALQKRVAALLQKAEAVKAAATVGASVLPYLGLGGMALAKLLTSDEQQQHAHNVAHARFLFDGWTTTKRSWVLAGRSATGANYTVGDWKTLGNEIGALLSSLLDLYWEATPLTGVVVDGTVASVKDAASAAAAAAAGLENAVKAVADPWPLWVKVALAGGGVAVVMAAVGYGLRQVRAFVPEG